MRAATQTLIRYAKQAGCALVLVGHVTKDGNIAGPKVVEHMVDTVLYFEGDRGHPFRILRGVKNRFGATDEIGVFEMAQEGLARGCEPVGTVSRRSRIRRRRGRPCSRASRARGRCWCEIQALVAPSSFGTPRRAVVGWDANRLSMMLAVLDARCGVSFAQHDVYLNVAGGLKITEPAADLAAAAALLSSLANAPLPPETVYFGEISLSGAIRPAGHTGTRLREAQKLGFQAAVIPAAGDLEAGSVKLKLQRHAQLQDVAAGLAKPRDQRA